MDYGAYKRKVMAGMMELPAGKIVEIDTVVDPKNRELFIQAMKGLIDADFGKELGWSLELNNQYLKFRKITIGKCKAAQNLISVDLTAPTPKTGNTTTEPRK